MHCIEALVSPPSMCVSVRTGALCCRLGSGGGPDGREGGDVGGQQLRQPPPQPSHRVRGLDGLHLACGGGR